MRDGTIEDRQYKSFEKVGGEWHRRTVLGGGTSIDPNATYLEYSAPDTVTEVYKYYDNSTDLDLLTTVTVIYTTAAKNTLVSVEYT